MSSFIKGSYVALITPFNNNDEIDYESLNRLIEYQISGNTAGIILFGTTGESPCLTDNEKISIMSHVINNYSDKINIIVGVGGNNTNQTLEFAKICVMNNINSIMVTVPNYNKPSQEGIYQHFAKIASNEIIKNNNIEIIMYNIPSRCGVNMEFKTVKRLSEDFENIVAIKEASGNYDQTCEIIFNTKLKVYAGDDSLVLPTMTAGGFGVVSVLGNILPQRISEIVLKIKNEDIITAQELYKKTYKLMKDIFIETNPQPIKYLAKYVNIIETDNVRLPMIKMNNNNKILIIQNSYNNAL